MGRAISTPYAVWSVGAHTIADVYEVTSSPVRYQHDRLVVRGAREHNLRNISVDLPRDSLIVFTGLSGSGKSSLAFDTIFAEGQRRYVESLSAYARQLCRLARANTSTCSASSRPKASRARASTVR